MRSLGVNIRSTPHPPDSRRERAKTGRPREEPPCFLKRGAEPAAIRRESRRDPQLGGVVHGEGAVTVGQAQVELPSFGPQPRLIWSSRLSRPPPSALEAARRRRDKRSCPPRPPLRRRGWGFPADPSGRKGTRGLSCRSLNSRPSSTRRYSPGSCPQRIGQAGARQPDEDGHAHTAVAEQPAYVVPYAGPGYSFTAPWM